MEQLDNLLARLGLSGVAAWLLNAYFGVGAAELLAAYLAVASLDILTGTCAAIKRRELKASKAFEGLLKKVCCVAAIALGHQVDRVLGVGGMGHAGSFARDWIGLAVIVYELKSNTENLAVMGILVPEAVQDMFARVLDMKADAAAKRTAAPKEEATP